MQPAEEKQQTEQQAEQQRAEQKQQAMPVSVPNQKAAKSQPKPSAPSNFAHAFTLPEGVSATFADNELTITNKDTKLHRRIDIAFMNISIADNILTLSTRGTSSREKKMLGTIKAHVANMLKGIVTPFTYTLKVCSGHFPMTVAKSGDKFTVKNFFSEKIPRELTLPAGVQVEIKGSDIEVTSPDKELAGQCAASIEQLTRRRGFDRRIFQDGIYRTKKP